MMSMTPTSAGESHCFKGVTSHVTVQAHPRPIYQAIRDLRLKDDGDVRVVSEDENQALLEETFDGLPIIGRAKCLYREHYKPFEKIEYKMVESDKFKAFEGTWQITPTADGGACVLQLSSYVDTGLTIPFARQITNGQTLKDIHERLTAVKKAAEASEFHRGLGAAGTTQ